MRKYRLTAHKEGKEIEIKKFWTFYEAEYAAKELLSKNSAWLKGSGRQVRIYHPPNGMVRTTITG